MALGKLVSYAGESLMNKRVFHRTFQSLAVVGVFASLSACDPASPQTQPPTSNPAQEPAKPVLWKRVQDSTVVAVDDVATTRSLEIATAEARRTVSDARQRWMLAKPAERSLWAVKWAAPLASASASGDASATEHVWVQPVNWSPFRIEGVLLSSPTAPLECGRSRGEIASFPIDELTDWIHFASEAPDAAFEGGYTVRVLEEKYGKTVD